MKEQFLLVQVRSIFHLVYLTSNEFYFHLIMLLKEKPCECFIFEFKHFKTPTMIINRNISIYSELTPFLCRLIRINITTHRYVPQLNTQFIFQLLDIYYGNTSDRVQNWSQDIFKNIFYRNIHCLLLQGSHFILRA